MGGGAAATLAPPETGTEGARNTCGARNRNGGRPQHMRHREQEGRAATTLARQGIDGSGTRSLVLRGPVMFCVVVGGGTQKAGRQEE